MFTELLMFPVSLPSCSYVILKDLWTIRWIMAIHLIADISYFHVPLRMNCNNSLAVIS